MTLPQVAVIIPTYRKLHFAHKAVASLLETTPEALAVIVDDGTPEWTEAVWAGLPRERCRFHRFRRNDGNLSRSWDKGLALARDAGVSAAVAANSDILFPQGWWPALQAHLAPGTLVGPLTNAPGHRPLQRISRYLSDYLLTDERGYLNKVQARLMRERSGQEAKGPLNGFFLAALTATWWDMAFDARRGQVFNPRYKLTRNEDELQGRWKEKGGLARIALDTFVFHYRGVSRLRGTTGKEGAGHFRPGDSRQPLPA